MSSVVPMFLGILFLLPSFFGSQWGPTYLIYAFLGAWLLETQESGLPCLPTLSPLCLSFQAN